MGLRNFFRRPGVLALTEKISETKSAKKKTRSFVPFNGRPDPLPHPKDLRIRRKSQAQPGKHGYFFSYILASEGMKVGDKVYNFSSEEDVLDATSNSTSSLTEMNSCVIDELS